VSIKIIIGLVSIKDVPLWDIFFFITPDITFSGLLYSFIRIEFSVFINNYQGKIISENTNKCLIL